MTVRVALIGCGAVARRMHIPALKASDGADIVAFVSRSRGSAEVAHAECGTGGAVYDDWRAVVARDDVDAVDICSPNAFHHEQAVAAARSGKHVLVEKPIAVGPEEARSMIEAAQEAGVVLHVAQNLRYVPSVLAARDVVASGRLGQIVGLRAAFGHSGPKDWAPDSTWFFDKDLAGGGALTDLGVHIIDVVRFVTGLEASTISALLYGTAAVEDAAQVIVRYANGAIGSIHASWLARPAPDIALTIFGTAGTLHFDARSALTFRSATGEKDQIELPAVEGNPYDDFVRACAGEEPRGPVATGADGAAAIDIIAAAYWSAANGRTLERES